MVEPLGSDFPFLIECEPLAQEEILGSERGFGS
jgi:hypothetical protein